MGTSNIEISILKKRLELLEMKIGELNSINPEILNERLAKIEERLYVVKEMLTTEEASKYLGISQSQIYKLTMNMQIPHFKPKGKTIRQSEALTLLMTRPDNYLRNGIYASSPKSVYEERISAKRSISIKKATRRPLYWREERIYLPFLEFFS